MSLTTRTAALGLALVFTVLVTPLTSAATSKSASPAASSPPPPKFKPGLWRIESVSVQDSTQTQRKMSSQVCLTPADANNLIRLVPPQMEPGMGCESKEARSQGQVITWRVLCSSGKQSMTGTGSITLSGDRYQGKVALELTTGGKPVALEQKVSAQRVQDCK